MGDGIVGHRKMVPTDGPLLRKLVGLCVDLIYPDCDVVVRVSLYWKCDNEAYDDAN